MSLENIISEFESHVDCIELINSKISSSSIGWQLEHSLNVFNAVCKASIKSNSGDYQWKFNFKRMIFLTIGYFPRGKVKAPKSTVPDKVSLENILEKIANAKSLLKRLQTLPPKSNFKHPIFGVLNLKQTKQFLKTHSNHHLKVIRDIKNKK